MHEIERLYQTLVSESERSPLLWPPDIFALCAYFAKTSGCYRAYASSTDTLKVSVAMAEKEGKEWRELLDSSYSVEVKKVPRKIRHAWGCIERKVNSLYSDLVEDGKFIDACLYLIVACDEACVGVGLPGSGEGYFELESELQLGSGSLCRAIPATSLRVLPKQHTPRSGFNIRSLTHHLALCVASEVCPIWTQIPSIDPDIPRASYNVLLAPWPISLHASDIRPATRAAPRLDGFGYFDYVPKLSGRNDPVVKWLEKLLQRSEKIGQHVDLIVFPECALTMRQWGVVTKLAHQHGMSIVAGIRTPPSSGSRGLNSLGFSAPYAWQELDVQHKHHRWQIDRDQISNYGLGGTLDRTISWWENIEIKDRKLNFFATSPDLVICPLICEDLARQDPVAELVRSVGPNLVVALLMDGPQLANRWSARYASVLADDPGSSVLTISSLGMVRLSRPRDRKPSRVFASWKDAFGSFVPLELGDGEDALILNLQFQKHDEHSVDGRRDGGVASFPVLCGTHPITV